LSAPPIHYVFNIWLTKLSSFSGAPPLEIDQDNTNRNNDVGELERPPETAVRPSRPGRLLAAVAVVDDDAVHSITPVARVFQAGRRRQRRVASPSPFVLQQQLPNSAGMVSGGAQVARTLKISSLPLGPSKRKLHMSPFASIDDVGGGGAGSMAARRRVVRRRVSASGRRRSTSGTPMIPRRRSFLAPPTSSDPPASQIVAVPLRTSIANSPL
jgi:hypothetical protein